MVNLLGLSRILCVRHTMSIQRSMADILIAVTDGLKGRSPGGSLSGHHAADLHRAPDPKQPGLRGLEGAQGAGRGDQAD